MGFLKKIFRGSKKKSKDRDNEKSAAIAAPSISSQNRRKREKGGKVTTAGAFTSVPVSEPGSGVVDGQNNNNGNTTIDIKQPRDSNNSNSNNETSNYLSPRSSTGPIDTDDDGIILPANSTEVDDAVYYSEVRNLTQEELRVAYENSRKEVTPKNDDNRSPTNDDESARLTSNQFKQWDVRHHHQEEHHHQSSEFPMDDDAGISYVRSRQSAYSMPSELPNQQIVAMDDMNRSDASSSSFNLSTDAEDSEYETMKRTSGAMYYPTGGIGMSALDTSAIASVTSVTSYTTDEDRKIFPNLPTDDEMTLGTEASSKMDSQPPSLLSPLQMNMHEASAILEDNNNNNEPKNIEIYPMSNDRSENLGASWTDFNPSRNNLNNIISSNENEQKQVTKSKDIASNSRNRHFFADPATSPLANNNEYQTNAVSVPSKISARNSRNKPGVVLRRDFTSPKSLTSTNTEYSSKSKIINNIDDRFVSGFTKSKNIDGDDQNNITDDSGFADFGNFADFSNFPCGDNIEDQEWTTTKTEKKDQPVWDHVNNFSKKEIAPSSSYTANKNSIETSQDRESFDDPFKASSAVGISHISGSSSGLERDKSLTELLETAKSKRKDRRHVRHSSRASSSSINSAPAITASFLRQHHNLGNPDGVDGRFNTGTSFNNNGDRLDRDMIAGDGTSVSDIIESLEATDRMKRAEKVSLSHRSMGDTGVVATARAAKERLRERRRRERDTNYGGIRNSLSRESDSDESDGNDVSESWLFDQVTGAIGPVGIAADLESLSGRSNRSKNSHGNKSHKSSNRRRSRKSSSRRHRSDRSVDSHGSRASRYSHRSTKSFLSQMSEQSRSVANDLLRLEMQLAMVGSKDKRDDSVQPRTGSSSASLGVASRGTTTRSYGRKSNSRGSLSPETNSSSIVRRSKTSIIAPPGKLGIILANKADSKGTVVSGVRTSSVLVDRISPGDRIVAIDGEDVSRMTVSEITTIMSRKAEYERRLTVLTIPKAISTNSEGGLRSPTGEFVENTFSSSYRR